MKRLTLFSILVLAAGAVLAANPAPPKTTRSKPASQKAASHKSEAHRAANAMTHEVPAQVVSWDVTAKTLTIKGETGKPDSVLKVEGSAVSELKTLKAGEKVMLMCRDNEKGEHMGVTQIKAARSTKS